MGRIGYGSARDARRGAHPRRERSTPCGNPIQSDVKIVPQLVHVLERLAAAAHDAGQRIFGDDHRQAGLFHQQAVEVAQQRAAAGEHHAALGDVGAELGRRLLERALHRRDDAVQRIGQRFEDLVATRW